MRPSAREHELTRDQKPEKDMTTTSSRPFIAAMQVTLDDYILGPEGEGGGAAGLEPGVCGSRLVG